MSSKWTPLEKQCGTSGITSGQLNRMHPASVLRQAADSRGHLGALLCFEPIVIRLNIPG